MFSIIDTIANVSIELTKTFEFSWFSKSDIRRLMNIIEQVTLLLNMDKKRLYSETAHNHEKETSSFFSYFLAYTHQIEPKILDKTKHNSEYIYSHKSIQQFMQFYYDLITNITSVISHKVTGKQI